MNDLVHPLPFVDLSAQHTRLGQRLDMAIARVIEHGQFILGPEVKLLEQALQNLTGAAHCVSCANGTDALTLVLMAEDIGPGDAVIVPSFTFVATAEAVAQLGATPILADVHAGTFNINAASIERAIMVSAEHSLKLRAIIAVDLFGLPADYAALTSLADEHGLILIADAAQSLGGQTAKGNVGTLAHYTTTSFFPAKPLGCYGDGGAIFSEQADKAELLRSLRFHGRGMEKYDNVRIGLNSRLDTMQAAVLLEKLRIFSDELDARERVAERYDEALSGITLLPQRAEDGRSSWAQYTLRLADSTQRDALRERCAEVGVPTAVYYPAPLHQQTGYKNFPTDPNGLPVSQKLSETVLSLPIHAYLDDKSQDRIIDAVCSGLGNRRLTHD